MVLTAQKCKPCEKGTPPLSAEQAAELANGVPGWTLHEKSIDREFRFSGFREAIAFVNRVADLAEEEGHHPDIHIYYSRVRLELSTHKIGGLSQNDFILAAKIDELGS
jgi:4a-hydroxytetrahydrobiopterin dehydratase